MTQPCIRNYIRHTTELCSHFIFLSFFFFFLALVKRAPIDTPSVALTKQTRHDATARACCSLAIYQF